MCRVTAAALAGLLLLALLLPHGVLGDSPTDYAITVHPLSGVYCDPIDVRITVPQGGTYYICWGDALISNQIATVYAPGPGTWVGQFVVPEWPGGNHTAVLHLVSVESQSHATANFAIYPTVLMTPAKGASGTVVTLKGYGFGKDESNIPIAFRSDEKGRVRANAEGSWDWTYTMDKLPVGSYPFDVEHDKLNSRGHIHFFVTPKIVVSPTAGVAGGLVKVSGTGFHPNESGIRITFGGEVVKDDVSSGSDGSFSAVDIVVPRRARGTYRIGASGSKTWAGDVPSVDFTIETGISVSPAEAYVGDEINVIGSGFAAWETGIGITFGTRAVDAGAIAADRYGTWEASFVVPTSTYDNKPVSASGSQTAAAAVKGATVKVLARITEVNPQEASPGDTVIINGDGFPANQVLTVRFANRDVREEVRSASDGRLSAIVTVPAASPVGALTITAAGGGAQASTDFTVEAKVLPTPQPLSPESDRRFRSGEVAFRWGRIQGNSATTYTVEITGPGGSQVISGIEALTYQVPKQEALTRGEYQWRVKAIDEFGNESQWSDPIPFAVSPISRLTWVIIGGAILTVLMAVAYREGKFKVTE